MTAKKSGMSTSSKAKKPAGTAAGMSKPVAFAEVDGRPAVKKALAAVPPAQRQLASRLDQIILETLPGAVSAVKYRKPSQPQGVPFYGLPGGGWLLHLNPLKGRVRLTFFAGGKLKPVPPLPSPGGSRAIDIPDDAEVDETRIKTWLRQAEKLPGWGRV